MGKRIRLGQLSGTTYGLKVSKEGQDVDSATGKNLLFDSTNAGKSPIYFGKTINIGNNAVNNSLGNRSDFDSSAGYITHSGTKLQYNPLVVVIEDATGQNLNHLASGFSSSSSGVYSSISGYLSRIGVTSSSIFTENIKETGAVYRTSAFYALSGTEGDSTTSTNNSYSMYAPTTVNVKQTVRSYCFSANSGDHPASDSLNFNPSNSTNQRNNTFGNSGDIYKSDVTDNQSNDFGHDNRLEFRKQTGEALNDKFFYKDDGSFYTVAKANLGGLPVTNAKVAISKVPLGYGFMRSEFMGF
tara:strand:- start:623 stop:1519 length:897 start_codon:yes stop_codon:yes gene_type:complete